MLAVHDQGRVHTLVVTAVNCFLGYFTLVGSISGSSSKSFAELYGQHSYVLECFLPCTRIETPTGSVLHNWTALIVTAKEEALVHPKKCSMEQLMLWSGGVWDVWPPEGSVCVNHWITVVSLRHAPLSDDTADNQIPLTRYVLLIWYFSTVLY